MEIPGYMIGVPDYLQDEYVSLSTNVSRLGTEEMYRLFLLEKYFQGATKLDLSSLPLSCRERFLRDPGKPTDKLSKLVGQWTDIYKLHKSSTSVYLMRVDYNPQIPTQKRTNNEDISQNNR